MGYSHKNNKSRRSTRVRQTKKQLVNKRPREFDEQGLAMVPPSWLPDGVTKTVRQLPKIEAIDKKVLHLRMGLASIDVLHKVLNADPVNLPSGVSGVKNPNTPDNFMKDDEIAYLKECIAKYANNFNKMARDTTVNCLQYTAQHLETRITRLKNFEAAK